MYVSKIKVNNYKSFLESEEIELVPGFNLIVGQNSAGKTALLEALNLKFQSKPHRSEKTVPKPEYNHDTNSKIAVSFTSSKSELNEIFFNYGGNFHIPTMAPEGANHTVKKFMKALNLDTNTFNADYNGTPSAFENIYLESWGQKIPAHQRQEYFVLLKSTNDTNYSFQGTTDYVGSLRKEYYGLVFLNVFKERIYMFNAERLSLSQCAFGTGTVLASDARNLAEVLNNLKSNPARYQRFNDAVKFIFPQINHISVDSKINNQVEIKIWTVALESERKDLAISLSESGTGIGQVLAILYVVLNSDHPTVILIDEPQSFLHPGAVRKLVEVLKANPKHQYIISTHSPTIVAACSSNNIILVKNEAGESKVELINSDEVHSLRLFLTDVGVKLSDIFGADNILWVEGKTEEICFPMIFDKRNDMPKSGVEILGVKQTGDFEGKYKKTVFEIYQRLSEGRSLLPPAIGFIFDKEGRTETEIDDLTRQSNGTVSFLQRRLYENYLLNPRAISAVTTAIDGFKNEPVTESEVVGWFESKKWDQQYFNSKFEASDKSDEYWKKNVHGAKLLGDFFHHFSEARVTYEKTTHSVELTKWLLENEPSDLDEIAELLKSTLC